MHKKVRRVGGGKTNWIQLKRKGRIMIKAGNWNEISGRKEFDLRSEKRRVMRKNRYINRRGD